MVETGIQVNSRLLTIQNMEYRGDNMIDIDYYRKIQNAYGVNSLSCLLYTSDAADE